VSAGVGHHPSVTVAMHAFRICSPPVTELRLPPPIRPNILLEFAYRVSEDGEKTLKEWGSSRRDG
jgi:hypothetical protein